MKACHWLLAGACALGFPVLATCAHARMPCGPASQVTAGLIGAGNRIAATMRIRTGGGLVPARIFASPKSSRWLLVIDGGDGLSCVVLIGEDWSPGRLPGEDA